MSAPSPKRARTSEARQTALVALNRNGMTERMVTRAQSLLDDAGVELRLVCARPKRPGTRAGAAGVEHNILVVGPGARGVADAVQTAKYVRESCDAALADGALLIQFGWLGRCGEARRLVDARGGGFAYHVKSPELQAAPGAEGAGSAACAAARGKEPDLVRVLSWHVDGVARLLADDDARARCARALRAHSPNVLLLQGTRLGCEAAAEPCARSEGAEPLAALCALARGAVGGEWRALRAPGGLAILSRLPAEQLQAAAAGDGVLCLHPGGGGAAGTGVLEPDAAAAPPPRPGEEAAALPPPRPTPPRPAMALQLARVRVGSEGSCVEGTEWVYLLNCAAWPADARPPADGNGVGGGGGIGCFARRLRGLQRAVLCARARHPQLGVDCPLVLGGEVWCSELCPARTAAGGGERGSGQAAALGGACAACARAEAELLSAADLGCAHEVVRPAYARLRDEAAALQLLDAANGRGGAGGEGGSRARVHSLPPADGGAGRAAARAAPDDEAGIAAELAGHGVGASASTTEPSTEPTGWCLHSPRAPHIEDAPAWYDRQGGARRDAILLSRLGRCRLESARLAYDACGSTARALTCELRVRSRRAPLRAGAAEGEARRRVPDATRACLLSYPHGPTCVASPQLHGSWRRILKALRGLQGKDRAGGKRIEPRGLAYERRVAHVAAVAVNLDPASEAGAGGAPAAGAGGSPAAGAGAAEVHALRQRALLSLAHQPFCGFEEGGAAAAKAAAAAALSQGAAARAVESPVCAGRRRSSQAMARWRAASRAEGSAGADAAGAGEGKGEEEGEEEEEEASSACGTDEEADDGGSRAKTSFPNRLCRWVATAARSGAEAAEAEALSAILTEGRPKNNGADEALARARGQAALSSVSHIGNPFGEAGSGVFGGEEGEGGASAASAAAAAARPNAQSLYAAGVTSVAAAQSLLGLEPTPLALAACDGRQLAELAQLRATLGSGPGGAGDALRALGARLHPTARWSLRHHDDLCLPLFPGEAAEIRQAVLDGLREVDASNGRAQPSGWLVQIVGGRRRGEDVSAHDVDLLITAPNVSLAGAAAALRQLVETLVRRGVVLGEGGAREAGSGKPMHMLSVRKGDRTGPTLTAAAGGAPISAEERSAFGQRSEGAVDGQLYGSCAHVGSVREGGVRKSEGNIDWHARFFGIYRSPRFWRARRIDLVLSSWLEYPFALLGWTGSRMLNRWLRLHAKAHGFSLNSHCLLSHAPDGGGLVPYQRPQGVGGATVPGNVVRTEADIYALLGLAYVPPHMRDA